jgi:dienelactone hydrolase
MGRKSAVSAILWLLCAIALGACGAGQRGPFAYDDGTPLDVRVSSSYFDGGVRTSELTYASPKGGRVPALLFVPSGGGPSAGLIVQHGLPSSKEDVTSYAENLARLGAVVIAIDAPFARRSGAPIAFTRRDRKEQIQLIVDLRRAVDLLRARAEVDDDRIAYLGISYGAAMGGLLAGVEHRIAAFVLMSGDGGLVSHFTGTGAYADGQLSKLPGARRKRWLDAMRPIESIKWIGRADAPILFLSGRNDELAPPADARKYQQAAHEPKDVRWYDSGHMLPSQAWCDAARFLGRQIGIAGNREPECGY